VPLKSEIVTDEVPPVLPVPAVVLEAAPAPTVYVTVAPLKAEKGKINKLQAPPPPPPPPKSVLTPRPPEPPPPQILISTKEAEAGLVHVAAVPVSYTSLITTAVLPPSTKDNTPEPSVANT
jgi:hypothetical protein